MRSSGAIWLKPDPTPVCASLCAPVCRPPCSSWDPLDRSWDPALAGLKAIKNPQRPAPAPSGGAGETEDRGPVRRAVLTAGTCRRGWRPNAAPAAAPVRNRPAPAPRPRQPSGSRGRDIPANQARQASSAARKIANRAPKSSRRKVRSTRLPSATTSRTRPPCLEISSRSDNRARAPWLST